MSETVPPDPAPDRKRLLFPRSGVMLGITLKVLSVFVFVGLNGLVKASEGVPLGQVVFFRSFFALFPICIFLAWQGQLLEGFKTRRPVGHIVRGLIGLMGMSFTFLGVMLLPLPEAITINYATPLFIVIFSALILHEQVRLFRWTAVLVGLFGVLVIMWPRLTVFSGDFSAMGPETLGAIAAFSACIFAAMAMIMVRALVKTERSATIVIYFSLTGAVASLATIPFGWIALSWEQAAVLVSAGLLGGIGQILLTESYRHAQMATIAPFEYSSMILAIIIGFWAFGDVPTIEMLIGGAIVIGAGIFIIYREHRLGIDRSKSRKASTPS